MLLSLSFNGIKKDYLICERGKRRSAFAPIKRNLLSIPGMAGAYLESTETEVRIIEQPIVINGKDRYDVRKLEEDLSAWLITEKAAELIFDDEPDRVYYAVIDGSLNIEDIARFGKGTITFICPDPYKYKLSTSPYTFLSDHESIINNGTVDAYPVFTATVKAPITNLDIVTEEAYMRIGEPYTVDETPFEREKLILRDTMQTLTGWATGSSVDGGNVSGSMYTDGETFRAQTYGTGTYWHGPAVKKSLSEELQDFQIDVFLSLKTTEVKEAGRVEVYLLDINNIAIGKLAIKEMLTGSDSVWGEARIGDLQTGHMLINTDGIRKGVWNQFYGILRLSRIGNEIKAYIAKIDITTGSHHTRWSEVYIDVEGKYLSKLAQIQVHIGQHGEKHWVRDIGVHEIRVYKIIQPSANQIPYIAFAGDTIEIDHIKNDIRLNGESRTDLKDFGASYFPLKKGTNNISCDPFAAVDLNIEWRERYK